jgi:flagellar assembly protein FliH
MKGRSCWVGVVMTSSFERRGGPRDPGARDPSTRSRLLDEVELLRGGTPGSMPPNAYARFIPREEVRSFSAWTPSSFGSEAAGAAAAEPAPEAEAPAQPPTAAEALAQLQAARQAGYHDGYRDGLVALDGFKQSYAQQITAQVTAVTQAFRQQLAQLEQALALQVAEVAILLARQVVRSEVAARPEMVADLVQEALAATLVSAQQIAVHLHPEDHALVQAHAGEALAARGARLVADPALKRGGCVIDSEAGVIDASLESRWLRAVEAMGRTTPFDGPADAARDTHP